MSCKTLQGKYAERLEAEKFIMNDRINELYNKLDAQDEIIEQQVAIISEQKKKIDKAIEYLKAMQNSDLIFTAICEKELLEILGDKE